MAEKISWDSLEAFQLKECYDLAARFEKLDQARALLWERGKRIDIPKNYTPIRADAAYPESEGQTVSEATYQLVQDGRAVDTSSFACSHKVAQLPESGEKEYLLALIALRGGRNETQRLETARHIGAALSYSPNDPRYITLAAILQEAGR